MKKRVTFTFGLSFLFPVIALTIVMTRVFGDASRFVGLGVFILGWGAFLFALRRHQRSHEKVQRTKSRVLDFGKENLRPILAFVFLLVTGWSALVLVPMRQNQFLSIDEAVLGPRLEQDLRETDRLLQGLDAAGLRLQEAVKGAKAPFPETQKKEILGAWENYLDHAIALDALVDVHKYFYQINGVTKLRLNMRSFLIGYAALAGITGEATELRFLVGGNQNLESLLNDARPALGVPHGSYTKTITRELANPKVVLRLTAGRAHLQVLDSTAGYKTEIEKRLVARAKSDQMVYVAKHSSRPDMAMDNPLDYLEAKSFAAWFPLQTQVSHGISPLRTTSRNNFVDVKTLQEARRELEPGDILLERRNWYLTNIGLPGFWPHAALYTGTTDEMQAYFADIEPDLKKKLEGKFSSLMEGYAALDGHDEKRVIEAVGEGVILNSLEHSGNADYLAILRPKLSKAEKLEALMRAFSHFGKPYDFNFDFVTDEAIVCSELIFKSYREKLPFFLSDSSGRKVLAPNDIAQQFAEAKEPFLEFIAFFDGSEEEQRASRRDEKVFRKTHLRPKWDIMQP